MPNIEYVLGATSLHTEYRAPESIPAGLGRELSSLGNFGLEYLPSSVAESLSDVGCRARAEILLAWQAIQWASLYHLPDRLSVLNCFSDARTPSQIRTGCAACCWQEANCFCLGICTGLSDELLSVVVLPGSLPKPLPAQASALKRISVN